MFLTTSVKDSPFVQYKSKGIKEKVVIKYCIVPHYLFHDQAVHIEEDPQYWINQTDKITIATGSDEGWNKARNQQEQLKN